MPAWLLSVIYLVIAGVLVVAMRKLRVWQLRSTANLAKEDADTIRVELVEYVKRKSYEVRTNVALGPFWKGQRLGDGDKAIILSPLLESETLLVMVSTSSGQQILERMIDWVFLPIRSTVVLNPQEWERMVHGVSAVTIIGDQHNDNRQYEQRLTATDGGSIRDVFQMPGNRGEVDFEINNHERHGIDSATFKALAAALRSDAATLPEGARRPLNELADQIEESAERPGPPNRVDFITRASDYVTLMSSAMTATAAVLEAIGHL